MAIKEEMNPSIEIPKRLELLGLTRKNFENYFSEIGEKPFRAKQLLKWIYRFRVRDFEDMTDMPIPLRTRLAESAKIGRSKVAEKIVSSDGVMKLLLELVDKNYIETVAIPTDDRITACLSTQVGCAFGCGFCATGKLGFIRNLTAGEIVGQFIALEEELKIEISNVVFMGMGEPLSNLESTLAVCDLLSDNCALALGNRRITISTIGIPEKIKELRNSGLKPKLAISLNAPDDKTRKLIMPKAAKIASIAQILEEASRYAIDTARWFTIEYVLISGVNDSLECADKLARLAIRYPCKVNLIGFNEIAGAYYKRPSEKDILKFQSYLLTAGVTATVRNSKGSSICASCGQLAGKQQHS